MAELTWRTARPDDHAWIVAVVDDWWRRPIAGVLPRLFLDHFWATSTVVESADGEPRAFLVGFLSPSEPEAAYIHLVGVHPDERGTGLGRELYERFIDMAEDHGCSRIGSITSPVNEASIAFHRAMDFEVVGPIPDYDGPGIDRVTFTLAIPDRR